MLKIGLTGGIGSGKTTVCRLFTDLGVPLIDADVIARQLVEPGQPGLTKLADTFGNAFLNPDGTLNRALLRQRAFSDSVTRQQLDEIMHPLVYAQITDILDTLSAVYCIIAVPLLIETKKTGFVDRVLVVDCPFETQLERILYRDKVSREQAEAIISIQASRQQRLERADDVIDNSSAPSNLAEQVKRLHNLYLFMATTRTISA